MGQAYGFFDCKDSYKADIDKKISHTNEDGSGLELSLWE